MRLFGGERIQHMMEAMKIEDTQPIKMRALTNSIESAQKKVEGRNFSIRRNVLQFDDVLNKQRELIYDQRHKVLDGEDCHEYILGMIHENIQSTVDEYLPDTEIHDNWNMKGLCDHYLGIITEEGDLQYDDVNELAQVEKKDIVKLLEDKAIAKYEAKDVAYGKEFMRTMERRILLQNVDQKWMDHIDNMEELRQGIYLRSYAQHNPVVEYRIEGFEMFDAMVASIREDTVRMLLTMQVRFAPKSQAVQLDPNDNVAAAEDSDGTEASKTKEGGVEVTPMLPKMQSRTPESLMRETVAGRAGENGEAPKKQPVRVQKVGRNDPCPCGSGRKFKNCHGKNLFKDEPDGE